MIQPTYSTNVFRSVDSGLELKQVHDKRNKVNVSEVYMEEVLTYCLRHR